MKVFLLSLVMIFGLCSQVTVAEAMAKDRVIQYDHGIGG
ncbi:hypothetical protein BLGI_870 [Brevibacillus laterosporus GI-9]|nr:hypothetical protein BLGI_870 [Brevibacillus laterosporus GI-9]